MLQQTKTATFSLVDSARRYVSAFTTPTLRLGVTGLAQAGKTVFITALVRNLTAGGRLPFFKAFAEGRIIRSYLEPQPDDNIPRFEYEAHLEALLSKPPCWPESTRHVSQLRITIEYLPSRAVWRSLGPRKLHLDIVDYPGEWLADLQMLEMSYAEWSHRQMLLARSHFRATDAANWLSHVGTLTPADKQDEDAARAAGTVFTTYLESARRAGHSLGTLGPGRFLMPGDLAGSPLLTFAPLDLRPDAEITSGTLAAMMARRYESYRTHVVKPFFRSHFARLDRQIVLVDALSALNHGQDATQQLMSALEISLKAFRPGARSWLLRFMERRIDRVVFAAAKADHLPHTSHDRLEKALAHLVANAAHRTETAGGDVKVMALAAIRATKELRSVRGPNELYCVQGTPLPGETLDGKHFSGDREIAIFPGDLPEDPVESINRGNSIIDVKFVRFRPPALSDPRSNTVDIAPWPHIRLDRALEYILGDQLQ